MQVNVALDELAAEQERREQDHKKAGFERQKLEMAVKAMKEAKEEAEEMQSEALLMLEEKQIQVF